MMVRRWTCQVFQSCLHFAKYKTGNWCSLLCVFSWDHLIELLHESWRYPASVFCRWAKMCYTSTIANFNVTCVLFSFIKLAGQCTTQSTIWAAPNKSLVVYTIESTIAVGRSQAQSFLPHWWWYSKYLVWVISFDHLKRQPSSTSFIYSVTQSFLMRLLPGGFQMHSRKLTLFFPF